MSNIQKITELQKGSTPVLSLFHNWSDVDHSFEEVKTDLKKAKSELSKKNIQLKIIDSILDDQKVQGQELNLKNEVTLQDEYVALYFNDQKVYPNNITVPVKNDFIISDKPFVLPLIASNDSPKLSVILLTDEYIKLYSYQTQLKEQKTDLPASLEAFVRENKTYTEEEPTNTIKLSKESYEDSRSQLLKRLLKTSEQTQHETILFASSHYINHFSKLKDSTNRVQAYEFNPSVSDRQELIPALLKKLEGLEKTSRDTDERMERSNDFQRVIALIKKHEIRELSLSKPFLMYHLGSWKMINELIEINGFLLRHPEEMKSFSDREHLFQFERRDNFNDEWTQEFVKNDLESQTLAKTFEHLWQDYLQNGRHLY
ncbi:MAG: hypothetical protein CME62_12585 [Halobacteriovoraceae bacterium]|nr:hypothetical protein [Halobacteriovoraceae bacterium]